MAVAGVGCLGYGLYSVASSLIEKTSLSLMAMILIALGAMIIPYRWVGIAAGIVLVALGAFMLATNYVTGQSLVIVVLGLIAVAERWRRI